MWFDEALFYQFYPLGVCGCPAENGWSPDSWNGALEGVPQSSAQNIARLASWIPHMQKLGVTAVYFSPLFQSDAHGYDTRDYYSIDSRLGSDADFARLCGSLHEAGIRIVLDGVFNHTGRGFWAFRDIQKNKKASPYKDWYHIDWNKNSAYDDGFSYEGWEGCDNLVTLNLKNPALREHIFGAIRKWAELFRIDGIRLDVAYLLDRDFCRALRGFTDSLRGGITGNQAPVLIGEILFNDYRDLVNPDMLHSCTNYECYKGLYSSFNDVNMFEIDYSLNRQYGAKGALYKDLHLLTFADNHDVSRLASILKDRENLTAAYTLLFMMPGTPCVYYGSEWGMTGRKEDGDAGLRPCLAAPRWNDVAKTISRLAGLKKLRKELHGSSYRTIGIANQALAFERGAGASSLYCAVNASAAAHTLPCPDLRGGFCDLLSGRVFELDGHIAMRPHEALVLEKV